MAAASSAMTNLSKSVKMQCIVNEMRLQVSKEQAQIKIVYEQSQQLKCERQRSTI